MKKYKKHRSAWGGVIDEGVLGGCQTMELLSALQYNYMVHSSLVVVNGIVKECHAGAEPHVSHHVQNPPIFQFLISSTYP